MFNPRTPRLAKAEVEEIRFDDIVFADSRLFSWLVHTIKPGELAATEAPSAVEMHSHLHTKDNAGCQEIMEALEECHNRHFLFKVFGGCNQLKRDVNKCLTSERGKKSGRNRETGLERRIRIESVWKNMDEGDFSALEEFTKRNT